MKRTDESFYLGVLVALGVVAHHDDGTMAKDIVKGVGGIENLKKVAVKNGNENDLDTIKYLENELSHNHQPKPLTKEQVYFQQFAD